MNKKDRKVIFIWYKICDFLQRVIKFIEKKFASKKRRWRDSKYSRANFIQEKNVEQRWRKSINFKVSS